MGIPIHRRHWSFGVLLLALTSLLAACMGPEIPMTGTVTDAYTGQPVASASVKVGSIEATTDAAGAYQIAKWNTQESLEVSADGYEPVSLPLAGQPGLDQPQPPSVTVNTTLRPNRISGTITDDYTGQPVAGAQVQASETAVATTDAEGRYTLSGVPESFTLTVNAPDYEPVAEAIERATDFNTALRPNVLAGTITDEATGAPLAGVLVKAGNVTATTDADGRYRLEGVAPDAEVEMSADGYGLVTQTPGRVTALDSTLRQNVLAGVITDQYSSEPIAGAAVTSGDASATTDDTGRYQIVVDPDGATVVLSADGYATVTETIRSLDPLDVTLRPDVLRSVLVDGTSGGPIKNATIIATETISSTDVAFARIDNSTDGSFTLTGIPETGYVQVLAPGYLKTVLELKPGAVPAQIELEPFKVKALYITAAVASAGPNLVNRYLDLIDRTELNTVIVDLKSDLRDDLGLIYYKSEVPIVQELDTWADYVDMPAFIEEARRRGIYTIARVQIFSHDNALADARPDWGIQDKQNGGVYADYPGPGIRYAWLDPTNRNVWDYNIQLSVEAAQMGFDEINFDYIRFPDWGSLEGFSQRLAFSKPMDPINDPEGMYNNIVDFMEIAHREINGAGAFFSIDVFGRVMLKPSLPISQDIARMAPHTDYIAPMPYPSLWWVGYLGLQNPTAHPYEVILGSLQSAEPLFEGKRALLRPWLQDHTDPWQGSRVVQYGPREVRAQIDATEDFGKAAGWMLYDSANNYTEAALKPAP